MDWASFAQVITQLALGGAALNLARTLAKRVENHEKRIVVLETKEPA